MRAIARWILAAGIALLAIPLCAMEKIHLVSAGDSASKIAKIYYGSFRATDALLIYNGRSSTRLSAGERLKVPFCPRHRVRAGDTWSALASRYLGQGAAYETVARLNGLSPRAPLQVGQEIVFPVVKEHRLRRGETLDRLAERFMGSSVFAEVLAGFNGIDDPRRLAVGAELRIPMMDFVPLERGERRAATSRKVPSPAPAKAAPKAASNKASTKPAKKARFAPRLDRAMEDYEAGRYEQAFDAFRQMERVVERQGTSAERSSLWRGLTFVYVAYDRGDDACAAYRRWCDVGGVPQLDPDRISPRIRRQIRGCSDR
ncbi:hypothetical protein ABI59_00780 [Acidobacteria bacterium Mor1]|nr:hypothetical protein ABI59_00780 [Acidobacteria bacterium Mor1]